MQQYGLAAGKQLCREGPGGQQSVQEPAVRPGGQVGQWCPGVHWEEHCQQVTGGDPAPLLR